MQKITGNYADETPEQKELDSQIVTLCKERDALNKKSDELTAKIDELAKQRLGSSSSATMQGANGEVISLSHRNASSSQKFDQEAFKETMEKLLAGSIDISHVDDNDPVAQAKQHKTPSDYVTAANDAFSKTVSWTIGNQSKVAKAIIAALGNAAPVVSKFFITSKETKESYTADVVLPPSDDDLNAD